MVFVDTNVVLRWLLNDHALSAQARRIVDTAKAGELLITDVVAAEIVYVLGGLKKDRLQVAVIFAGLGDTKAFRFEHETLVARTVELLARSRLDFADCYLIARAVIEDRPLHTFDKSMQKMYMQVVAENSPTA